MSNSTNRPARFQITRLEDRIVPTAMACCFGDGGSHRGSSSRKCGGSSKKSGSNKHKSGKACGSSKKHGSNKHSSNKKCRKG